MEKITYSVNQSLTHPAYLMPREPKLALRNMLISNVNTKLTWHRLLKRKSQTVIMWEGKKDDYKTQSSTNLLYTSTVCRLAAALTRANPRYGWVAGDRFLTLFSNKHCISTSCGCCNISARVSSTQSFVLPAHVTSRVAVEATCSLWLGTTLSGDLSSTWQLAPPIPNELMPT